MEVFIKKRLEDRRFHSASTEVLPKHEVSGWAPLVTTITRVNASKTDHSPKKKESESESSDSDGGPDDKSPRKKKKKKKNDEDEGDESGRCWKGYKPVPGKAAYSEGSCEKA